MKSFSKNILRKIYFFEVAPTLKALYTNKTGKTNYYYIGHPPLSRFLVFCCFLRFRCVCHFVHFPGCSHSQTLIYKQNWTNNNYYRVRRLLVFLTFFTFVVFVVFVVF